MGKKTKKALIIVDVQNDFCPGGALAVPEGDKIIGTINRISSKFDKVVGTSDWHPLNHISFAKTHNKNPYETIKIANIQQTLWTEHCVAGTFGAEFHNDLDTKNFDLILRKGTNSKMDSYSAFFENDKKTKTGLNSYLKELGIKDVYVCGLATDYCVFYTGLDAIRCGFNVYIVVDAAKGIDVPEGNIEKSLKELKKKGGKIIISGQL